MTFCAALILAAEVLLTPLQSFYLGLPREERIRLFEDAGFRRKLADGGWYPKEVWLRPGTAGCVWSCRALAPLPAAAIAAGAAGGPAEQNDAARMGAEMMNPGSKMPYRERKCSGEFRVLVYGNSIALHSPKADIGWTNCWGMAASAPEKDFAHLVVMGLEKRLGKRADFLIRNLAVLERNFTTNLSSVAEIAGDIALKPDYVVIAIGENTPDITAGNADAFRRFIADLARPFARQGARIVLRSTFWKNEIKARCIELAAKETGAAYVDAGHLCLDDENKALGLFAHKGVANHPGDLGMRRLADLILAAFR